MGDVKPEDGMVDDPRLGSLNPISAFLNTWVATHNCVAKPFCIASDCPFPSCHTRDE